MSTFVSRISPVTGRLEWIMQNDNYDFHQEVARSSYGDMLHDTERNKLYEVGLKLAIDRMHSKGKQAFVLDIGTGTGLLSMMAVRAGADKVVACEAFKPIADCALKVIEKNNMADRIKIIKKRSTEMDESDLGGRANILVAEVFDTELIGEGALSTFHHACAKLLDPHDRIVVPSSADIIAQPVSCPYFRRWHEFGTISIDDDGEDNDDDSNINNNYSNVEQNENQHSNYRNDNHIDDDINHDDVKRKPRRYISPPKRVTNCPGAPSVHDVQLDRLDEGQFVAVGDAEIIFSFDFTETTSGGPLKLDECKSVDFKSKNDATVDCIFMWWRLKMDMDGEVVLSTAPRWGHPTPDNMQWRDHWMQAVYYPPRVLKVTKGQGFKVICCHDEYSLWFDVEPDQVESVIDNAENDLDFQKKRGPGCNCWGHVACSHTRVAMLNDKDRNRKYIKALKQILNEKSVCFCSSDDSLLPLLAAKLGAKKVISLQPNQLSRHFIQSYVDSNGLQNQVKVISSLEDENLPKEKINVIIGDPYYSTSLLSWHNFHFLYAKSELMKFCMKGKISQSKKKKDQSSFNDDATNVESTFFPASDGKNKVAKSMTSSSTEGLVILPCCASIKAIAVEFENLHKVRGTPVKTCEGFDLDPFDRLMSHSSDQSDTYLEPHPLWEYPSRPLTEDFELLFFNFDAGTDIVGGVRQLEREGLVEFISPGTCNAVVVWCEYKLTNNDPSTTDNIPTPTAATITNDNDFNTDFTVDDNTITTGLISPPEPDQPLTWDPYSRQGVHFFKVPRLVDDDGKSRLRFKTKFHPKTGEFDFQFSVLSSREC